MGESETKRRYLDYLGRLVILTGGESTMYDGLNHALWRATEPPSQMITLCGKRACPVRRLREVPGRGPVDCPECIETA